MVPPQLSTAGAFEALRQLWNGVVLAVAHEDVAVVRTKLQGIEPQIQPFGHPAKAGIASLFNQRVLKDITPVLGRELEVVVRLSEAVFRVHGSGLIAVANH